MIIIIIVTITIAAFITLIYTDTIPKKVDTSNADIVIIGAGTAGCILAKRLNNKHPKKRILILERGIDRHNDKNVYNIANAAIAGYELPYSEVIPTSDTPPSGISVGKMYGGGNSHNFASAVHGSPRFYEAEWGPVLNLTKYDFARYVKKIENYAGTSENKYARGRQGAILIEQFPVSVSVLPRIIPVIKRFVSLKAVEGFRMIFRSLDIYFNSGALRAPDDFSNSITKSISESTTPIIPIVNDYNLFENCTSISPQMFFDTVTGRRSSTDVDYTTPLSIVRDRNGDGVGGRNNNIHIKSGATVERVVILNNLYATGVVWGNGDITTTTNVKEKVILSAGGIYSPQILKASGYVDNDVGKNMFNHYGTTLIFSVPKAATTKFSNGPIAFAPRKDSSSTIRDWQLVTVSSGAVNKALIPSLHEEDDDIILVQFLLWLMHPRSLGDIIDDNDIKLNMFSDGDLTDPDSDLSSITDGMEWMKEIVDGIPDAKVVFPTEDSFSDRNTLSEKAKEGVSATAHYSGTCRDAINFNDFSVKGLENVHVVDASVFPSISNGNTAFPVYMISEIASDRI